MVFRANKAYREKLGQRGPKVRKGRPVLKVRKVRRVQSAKLALLEQLVLLVLLGLLARMVLLGLPERRVLLVPRDLDYRPVGQRIRFLEKRLGRISTPLGYQIFRLMPTVT
jgi:hypothetical protein